MEADHVGIELEEVSSSLLLEGIELASTLACDL